MMRKASLILTVIIMALIGGVAISRQLGQKDTPEVSKSNTQAEQPKFDDAQAALVDPCIIFDLADIEKVYSTKFSTGIAEEQGNQTADGKPIIQCEYRQTNDGTAEGLKTAYVFRVMVENYNSADNARAQMESIRSNANDKDQGFEVTDVQNIGDVAFFYTPKAPALNKSEESLYFTKDAQLFRLYSIKISGIDHDTERKNLEAIANTKF